MSLEPGSIVGGDFQIVSALSSGGMGSVYIAEQLSVGRRRALKLMHRELLADAKLRDRFVQEAKVGATIDSEHVVEVIAAGVDEKLGMPWLAMELLEGKDLAGIISARGPLPLADVREVVDQLCHALSAAHVAGIVHRDLKPENVFIARARRRGTPFVVKVLDFGIAKVVAEARATSAATAALGTPLYMAPEQTESRSKVAPPADVWALGLVVFRALTGKHFWLAAHAEAASMTALMREVVLNPIPAASERAREYGVADKIPYGFDEWFARCVERDPARRFADAGAAHEALARVGEGADAAPVSVIDDALRAVASHAASRESTALRTNTQTATPTPASTERRGETELASAVAPRAHTIAAAPLTAVAIGRPIGSERGTPPPSRTGLIAGVAAAVTAVGLGVGYMLIFGGRPAATRTAASSVDTRPPSAAPSATAAGPTGENPFIDIALPASPVTLGVPADNIASSTRGLRPSQRAMSPKAPYAIQAHEVTWAELDPWLSERSALKFARPPGVPGDPASRKKLPATGVPWEVAGDYCKSIGGSLPSEEQWEYAARGASRRAYSWGDAAVDLGGTHAFAGPTARVVPVMSSTQDVTPEGVYDLMGNAREWTSTLWHEDAPGGAQGWAEDGDTSARVVRGWPLRADPPASFEAVQAYYRDYACATGGCSPLHPDIKAKPPLLPFAVAGVASTPASPLRAWVAAPGFADVLGRCARGTKSEAPLEWKLRAELKVGSSCKDPLHGWYVPGDEARSTIFASQPAATDSDGDGIPDSSDKCPNSPEDKDGFQDSDGCPDPDNDADGVPDVSDKCSNLAGTSSNGGCPEANPAPTAEKPAVVDPVRPAPRGATSAGASSGCQPTHALVLSSKDMPAEVVACLGEAAAVIQVGGQAWSDEVALRVTRTALPAVLAETGFRCVAPR